jgi:hypothetical protein
MIHGTMRTSPSVLRFRHSPLDRKKDDTPVLLVPPQGGDVIRRRREIREAFHDSKALTIKSRRRR